MFNPQGGQGAPTASAEGGLLSSRGGGLCASWDEADHGFLAHHFPEIYDPSARVAGVPSPTAAPPASDAASLLAAAAAAQQAAQDAAAAAALGVGGMLTSGSAPPGWHESYSVSSVLVAHVTNLHRATRKLGPEDELLAYHRVTAALDRVLAPDRDMIWKVANEVRGFGGKTASGEGLSSRLGVVPGVCFEVLQFGTCALHAGREGGGLRAVQWH